MKHEIRWSYHSPLGEMTIVENDRHLSQLRFKADIHYPFDLDRLPLMQSPLIHQVCVYLDDYFQGINPIVDFPSSIQYSFTSVVCRNCNSLYIYGLTTKKGVRCTP